MCFRPRESQTRIKHQILHDFAGAWAGIITGGFVRDGSSRRVQLIYLDAFAGCGCYDGEADGTNKGRVWGSPIIGMKSLEGVRDQREKDGLTVTVSGIAIEKEEANYRELIGCLSAGGVKAQVVEAKGISAGGPSPGSITVIHGDANDHVSTAIDCLKSTCYLLALLDPYGPSLPLELAQKVVGRPHTDCIIFFPTDEVMRKGATVLKEEADLVDGDQSNLTRLDNLFGERAGWAAIGSDEALGRGEREAAYVSLYRELIQDAIPDGVVKDIGLRFTRTGNTGYHLILTTRDADGALKMNEILRKAGYREHWTLWQDLETRAKEKAEATSGLELGLDTPYKPKPLVAPEKPEKDEVDAEVTAGLVSGEKIRLKDLLGRYANGLLTRSEIVSSLVRVKKKGLIEWDGRQSSNALIKVV